MRHSAHPRREVRMNPPASSANLVEFYDAVRRQIEHEDNLVAGRLS